MQFIPVKTRTLQPPEDDLFSVFEESLPPLKNGDVVLVTSKVVSIQEGRCVPAKEVNIDELKTKEADVVIPRPYWRSPLTIINHLLVGGSGVDKSNGAGYIILLPKTPFKNAKEIHQYLVKKFGLKELGVIITDSVSEPLRNGAVGKAIAWWGIKPLIHHKGKPDLFGRKIKVERTNVIDSIASSAVLLMGEVAEAQPLVIARDIPNLTFTDEDTKDELFTKFSEDTFRVLYKKWL